MAITSALCTSFKVEMLGGTHVFGTDTFKLALIKPSMAGTYDSTSTNYSNITGNSDEVTNSSGSAYSAGGVSLTIATAATSSGTTAYLSFNNPSWTTASFSAAGCMIYNSSKSNKAVGVWDFGGPFTVSAGTFTINMPAADSTHAIIRIG
jgi:hypothetical protein